MNGFEFKDIVSSVKSIGDKLPDFFSIDEKEGPLRNNNIRTDFNVPEFGNQNLTAREVNADPEVRDKEQVAINEQSPYSSEINENIRSVDELQVYIDADLHEQLVGEKSALVRSDIDLDARDDDGNTNIERMQNGKPPLDKEGNPIELHHIGQKSDSPLAELTRDEHRGTENTSILHDNTNESQIDRADFQKEKREYWKARAEEIIKGQ